MLDALLSRPPPRAPPTPDRAPLSTLANGHQPRSASGAVKPTTTTDAEPSPTLGLSALMSRTSGEGRLSDLAPPPPNSVLHVPVLFDERDSRTSSVSGIAISEEADEPADLRGVKNGSWVSAGSPLSRQYTVFVPEHDRYLGAPPLATEAAAAVGWRRPAIPRARRRPAIHRARRLPPPLLASLPGPPLVHRHAVCRRSTASANRTGRQLIRRRLRERAHPRGDARPDA